MTSPFTNKLSQQHLATKVRSMAIEMEPDEVAERCQIPLADVMRIIGAPTGRFWLRCNKSGRTWIKTTQRGCYRIVCAEGLTDWDWGKGATVGEGALP